MGSMHVFLLLAWFLVSMGTQLLPQLTRWQLMLEIVAWVASWYGLQVHSTKQHIRKECIIMSQVMQAIMLRSAGRKPWLQCKEKAWLCDKFLQQTSTSPSPFPVMRHCVASWLIVVESCDLEECIASQRFGEMHCPSLRLRNALRPNAFFLKEVHSWAVLSRLRRAQNSGYCQP